MRIIILVLFFCLTLSAHAQKKNKRKKKSSEQEMSSGSQPSSLEPSSAPQEVVHKKRSGRRSQSTGPVIETREEYVARMEKTVKDKRKTARMLEKPQYSDPMYFGHKRPPKKRKPSKMIFCKECGIRH